MSISLKNDAGTFSTNLNQSNPTANVDIALPTTSGTMATLESPVLTGTPTAPTAAVGTNTTQLATTAFAASQDLGVGQTWQDVTGSRVLDTTYTNSTGKPIVVSAGTHIGAGVYQLSLTAIINGTAVKIGQGSNTTGNTSAGGNVVVPAGATYKLTSGFTLTYWLELR